MERPARSTGAKRRCGEANRRGRGEPENRGRHGNRADHGHGQRRGGDQPPRPASRCARSGAPEARAPEQWHRFAGEVRGIAGPTRWRAVAERTAAERSEVARSGAADRCRVGGAQMQARHGHGRPGCRDAAGVTPGTGGATGAPRCKRGAMPRHAVPDTPALAGVAVNSTAFRMKHGSRATKAGRIAAPAPAMARPMRPERALHRA